MADQHVELVPGDIVSEKFRVVRLLGRGATSHVYAAEVLASPGVLIALKVLRSNLSLHRAFVKRFEREGRIVQLVKSKYFSRFLGADIDRDGLFWMAFELFEGESLDRLLPPGKARFVRSADDVVWIVRDILYALRDAHAAQIIHRDVKPSNIFIRVRSDQSLRAILLDFGVSKLLEAPDGGAPSALTVVGTAIGTPDYMAPEQLSDATKVDVRSDIYALGVVAFYVLSGRLPFVGRFTAERAVWKQANSPMSLREATNVVWPALLEEFLRTAMARDPSGRYPTALAAIAAWQEVEKSLLGVRLPHPGGDPSWSLRADTKTDHDDSL